MRVGLAPLSVALHERIRERSARRSSSSYGMTETLMLTTNPYDGERRPGTVGFPFPGVELRRDRGTSEIQVKGPNVFAGYRRRRI